MIWIMIGVFFTCSTFHEVQKFTIFLIVLLVGIIHQYNLFGTPGRLNELACSFCLFTKTSHFKCLDIST